MNYQEDEDPQGAVGGQLVDSTDLKSVESPTMEVVIPDAENGLSDSLTHKFLTADVDLREEGLNNLHQKKCTEQFSSMETKCNSVSKSTTKLNIPLDVFKGDRKSNSSHMAMAEMQNSFQTLSSVASQYPAMSIPGKNNINVNENTSPDALVTSLTGAQPNFQLRSQEDNNNMASNLAANSRSTTSSNPTCSSTNNNSSNLSSVSRYSSRRRSFITNDTYVSNCPKDFIDFLSNHFDGRYGKNWESLLGLYGYSYKDIKMFGNKAHVQGYFRSVLDEDPFQNYTIDMLKEDLYNIPKRDTLVDVERWIEDYNKSL